MERSKPEKPCDVFHDLHASDFSSYLQYDDSRPVAAFQASSERGCWGCKIVVKLFHGQGLDQKVQYSIQLLSPDLYHNDVRMAIWESKQLRTSLSGAIRTFSILSFPGSSCPWPDLPERTPISGNTGSDEAVARVHGWLDHCAKEHMRCPGPDDNTQLPTRVLKIDEMKHVRLYLPIPGEVAPYLCLSHCWGTSRMITTTLSNMAKHQVGILWDDLPKTFQHAIDFTYRLGFRYLWIDSLCIVQDSVADWRHEAGRMAGVYQGSSLTICASLSADSSGGCYATAEPQYLSQTWELTGPGSKTFEIHTCQPLDHIDASLDNSSLDELLPLLKRGWALQERLLSPRTVSFTARELVWSCSADQTCECSPSLSIRWGRNGFQPDLWPKKSVEWVHSDWAEIVETYSEMELSFDEDIFPALQGFAKLVPPEMGQYLAGLWRETLVSGLCWFSWGREKNLRPKDWRAPTWSWASVTGRLTMSWLENSNRTLHRIRPAITIIEATTTPKGTDPRGELSSGELLIRGRCVKLRVVHGNSFKHSHGQSSLSFSYGNEGEEKLTDPYGNFGVYWDYAITAPGPGHVSDGSKVVMVRLLDKVSRLKTEGTGEAKISRSRWLVLQSSKHDPEAFERIGLAVVEDRTNAAWYLHLEKIYSDHQEIDIRII